MSIVSDLLLAATAATLVAFIVGAATIFDVRTIEWKSRIFAVLFVAVVLTTLGYQAAYPSLNSSQQVISAILLFLSVSVFSKAAAANRSKKLTAVHSSDLPQHLVTIGPYAHIRHPFYAAYIAAFAASAFASHHPLPTACAVLCWIHYYCAAHLEEQKFLQSEFAESYRTYRARTGMFLPRLWRK